MKTIFYADRIEIRNYPFRSCSLSQEFTIQPKDIKEVRTKRWPPEIVLNSGEVIFLDYASHINLELFARINSIPQLYRLDVWSLLCEPFLDTKFDKKDQERTLQQLSDAGFFQQEVDEIRKKVCGRMLLFNSFVWEWVHLSHYDVLIAFGEKSLLKCLFSSKQKRFYDWCNQIANRAPETKELFSDAISKTELKLGDTAYALTRKDSKVDFETFKKRMLDAIIGSYNSLERHYHNLEHIIKVVNAVELYQGTDDEKTALKLAAWFHDIVYDSKRNDNEENSIRRFEEITADTGITPETASIVRKLILLTKNHAGASSELEKSMADADMLIFAEDAQTYSNYVSGIRQEYSHLPSLEFVQGRLAFLKALRSHMQNGGTLFFNLHPMHEMQANKNINTEIAELETQLRN